MGVAINWIGSHHAKIDSNFSKKCEKFWVTYLSHYIIGKSILKEEVLTFLRSTNQVI